MKKVIVIVLALLTLNASAQDHVIVEIPESYELSNIISFKINSGFQEFILLLNWWGIDQPLLSKNQVMLKPQSYILLQKGTSANPVQP